MMRAKIKHIELEVSFGGIYDVFTDAKMYAEINNCLVTFPFNGSKYCLNRYVEWDEDTYDRIMDNIGKGKKVLL